jgi:hypothetical protein
MIDALSNGFNERDLTALVAFAKSELGKKFVAAARDPSTGWRLTHEEEQHLRGLPRIRVALTFSRIPKRLEKVNAEAQTSMAVLAARVDAVEARHQPPPAEATPHWPLSVRR